MKKTILNYQTLIKVTEAISHSKDPEEVALMTVQAVRDALGAKGCSLFFLDKKTSELNLVASFGLSSEYLAKGPVIAHESIAQSLEDGPVAIADIMNDPRLQYPNQARQEGIASILSVPMIVSGNVLGAMRVYTAERWEFTLEDITFVQAIAQIAGVCVAMARNVKGLQGSIDILKTMKDIHGKEAT